LAPGAVARNKYPEEASFPGRQERGGWGGGKEKTRERAKKWGRCEPDIPSKSSGQLEARRVWTGKRVGEGDLT